MRITGWLGMLAIWSGDDHDLAEGFLSEGMGLLRQIGDWEYGAYCLEGFAGLAGAREQGARAARLWGAAQVLRRSIGAPLPPEPRPYYGRSMAATRVLLGEALWEAAFTEGSAMSAEEAAEYALSEEVAPAPESPTLADRRTGGSLTTREQEVAAMVARGLSNRQIASQLHLSERTVENHVSKILRKLGLASRAEIAAWTTERRLLTPDPD
jgi:DNA-binding CsgD family transcriptional regulator